MIASDSTDKEIVKEILDNVQSMSLEETISFCYEIGKRKGVVETLNNERKDMHEVFAEIYKILDN